MSGPLEGEPIFVSAVLSPRARKAGGRSWLAVQIPRQKPAHLLLYEPLPTVRAETKAAA